MVNSFIPLDLRKSLAIEEFIVVLQYWVNNHFKENPEEIADFGMLFGFHAPKEKLSEKIYQDTSFEVFENIDKMKEKCTLYEDIPR